MRIAPNYHYRSRPSKPALLENLESRLLMTTTTPIGVNLEAVTDWSRAFVFVDAMKSARALGTATSPWDGKATLDASGQPVGDFGAVIITINSPTLTEQDFPAIDGTYHLKADGSATIKPIGGNINIVNQIYDPITKTTTADVVVKPGATTLYLSFTNTQNFRNVELIRPGYDPNTTQIFTNEFLKHLEPFTAIRFMDFLHTNDNKVVEWADRAKPTDAVQSSDKGAAWEYVIELANESNTDLWINVPAHASDDYITNLAQLLKDTVDSDLNVYVEYSNEVWNHSFEQGRWNHEQALAQETANPGHYSYDGSTNTYGWGWRRVSEQIHRVEELFAKVYGRGAINDTVRPVLASQVGFPYVLRDQLDYYVHRFGDPAESLHAIASAPYINIGDLSYKPDLTTDEILNALRLSAASMNEGIKKYSALAAFYGLEHLIYEGGVDVQGDTNGNFLKAKLPAQYRPEMRQILTDYFQNMYANGVEMLMYFQGTGAYSTFGTWGLTENVTNLTGHKYAAVTQFANGATPAITAGNLLPDDKSGNILTIPAGRYLANQWQTTSTNDTLGFPTKGNIYDYLINAPTAGVYTLELAVANGSGAGKLEILIDNKRVALIDVPQTGSSSNFVTIPAMNLVPGDVAGQLSAGLHTIRLRVVESGFWLKSLTLNASGPDPIPATQPDPIGLIATPTSETTVALSWRNLDGRKGIVLERSTDGINFEEVAIGSVLPGDTNSDGDVDFADFITLTQNYGKPGGWEQGNFLNEPTVGFGNFSVLTQNFGKTSSTGVLGSSFVDTNLDPGGIYFYRIRVATSTGEVDPDVFYDASVAMPFTPTASSFTAAPQTSDTSVTLPLDQPIAINVGPASTLVPNLTPDSLDTIDNVSVTPTTTPVVTTPPEPTTMPTTTATQPTTETTTSTVTTTSATPIRTQRPSRNAEKAKNRVLSYK